MVLYLIGSGMNGAKSLTIESVAVLKNCNAIFIETYTSVVTNIKAYEQLIGKKIIFANRELVEKNAEKELLLPAKNKDIALLIMGHPLGATTHVDLLLRAKELGVKTQIFGNESILTAIAKTGLQLYKFGKTASIPFGDERTLIETPYNILADNQRINAHTLLLLDLNPDEQKYLSLKKAISQLLSVEQKRRQEVFTEETLCIGCARLGATDELIIYGTAEDLSKKDSKNYFGAPPYCLIIPAPKLHFLEEESLNQYKIE